MPKLLVHVTCGPEHPTKAALAFLVATSALDEGHEVTLFLAGDAVQLLRESVLDGLVGLGTGALRAHYDALVAGGATFHVSGKSAAARGLDDAALAGKAVTRSQPNVLVRLAFEADRTLVY
jgi:uncharacterized protein